MRINNIKRTTSSKYKNKAKRERKGVAKLKAKKVRRTAIWL